ncbi:MAG: PTS sugar transporter subunit IIA [Lachnospiraceae bacterium]|jgi:PTS system galactitol-specific IIA component|nr:PTS sugar transporter subunit IIA [Lachnospiraceae bacterium]
MEKKTNALGDVLVSPELVLMEIEAGTDQEAIEILARHLFEQGIVKESYIEAVKAREKVFSTGLDFEEMGIAIPHTDSEHVNREAIAIGILKKPVLFCHMGMPEISVKTEMMFMMAIEKPDSQVEFLGKMMEIFQTEGRLRTLKAALTAGEAARLFTSYFDE